MFIAQCWHRRESYCSYKIPGLVRDVWSSDKVLKSLDSYSLVMQRNWRATNLSWNPLFSLNQASLEDWVMTIWQSCFCRHAYICPEIRFAQWIIWGFWKGPANHSKAYSRWWFHWRGLTRPARVSRCLSAGLGTSLPHHMERRAVDIASALWLFLIFPKFSPFPQNLSRMAY